MTVQASEAFLQRMVALYASSHYKNTPNDLILMSDAPAHHLFALLGPVDETQVCPLYWSDGAFLHLLSWCCFSLFVLEQTSKRAGQSNCSLSLMLKITSCCTMQTLQDLTSRFNLSSSSGHDHTAYQQCQLSFCASRF